MTTPSIELVVWTARPGWFDLAACRGLGHAMFFPDQGDLYGARDAQAVCDACPVRRECMLHALTQGEHHGIWGGTTERARQRIRGRATTAAGATGCSPHPGGI